MFEILRCREAALTELEDGDKIIIDKMVARKD